MTKISKKHTFWLLAGVLLIASFIVLKDAIRPFLMSFVITYLFLPCVDALEKRKISRGITSSFIVAIVFVGFIAFVSLLIPFLYTKIASFFQDFVVDGADKISDSQINKLSQVLNIDSESVFNFIQKVKIWALDLTLDSKFIQPKTAFNSIVTIIATIIVMPIITFYMLKDWRLMVEKFFSLIPESKRIIWQVLARQIDISIFAYLRGQLNVCLFFIVYYSILLQIAGLNLGFALGLMVGILMFIPYVGFFVGCTICMILAFLQFGIVYEFWSIAIIFTVGQIIDANYTTPKFVGDKVGIHPVIIVFGLFASTCLFGITGAIFALPITTATTILARYLIARYRQTYYFE